MKGLIFQDSFGSEAAVYRISDNAKMLRAREHHTVAEPQT